MNNNNNEIPESITLKELQAMCINAAMQRNDWKMIAELTIAISDPARQEILNGMRFAVNLQPTQAVVPNPAAVMDENEGYDYLGNKKWAITY